MSEADMIPIGFAILDSGPRLGVFSRLDPNVKVMPSGPPNLSEVRVWLQTRFIYVFLIYLLIARKAETAEAHSTTANYIIF
jgi:hypothetical protein